MKRCFQPDAVRRSIPEQAKRKCQAAVRNDTAEPEVFATLAFLELEAIKQVSVWDASLILVFHCDEGAVEEDHSCIILSS
jgi:hypothetical protein